MANHQRQRPSNLAAFWTWAIISCINMNCIHIHAFHVPNKPLASSTFKAKSKASSSTALSLSDNTNANMNNPSLPFFAAPAFSSSSSTQASSSGTMGQQQQQAVGSSPPQSATVTLRLPLGTLFDGRDYTFVTESNVRGYEWTTKETDILLDDLMDAALGNLGGMPDDKDPTVTNAVNDNVNVNGNVNVNVANQPPTPPGIITDYELSQIVLVPTSDWDSSLLGLGNRYDVYDGQQRLVTLNLLLAGLRDSFQAEANALLNKGNGNGNGNGGGSGGKRAVALAATAIEIAGMLMPTKVRKEDVLRIKLRKRDNVLLENILIGGSSSDGSSGSAPDDGVYTTSVKDYTKLSPKGKANLLSPLSPANARIFSNFVHLSNRLSLLTTRERLRLLDYIVERVYLLVCIPETSRIARNIVMSQGRKGMDNEPVDDFKGLVCFRYTLEEEDMYQTFDRWDALAAEPLPIDNNNNLDEASNNSGSSNIVSVGRDIITSACLLRASAVLRTKIRSRGGDEVYAWERWIRQELWLKNQRMPQQQEQTSGSTETKVQPWQGKDFFIKEIEPASIALYKFRTGQWDEFAFLSKTNNKKMTKKQRDTIIARLNFLRDITMGVASAKEAEVVVLELLLRAEGEGDSSNSSWLLDEILPLVEKWTLWMALARPSPMQRHARVFALLDAMDDVDSVGSELADSSGDNDLGTSVRTCMNEYEFGASAGGKRLAAAILKRMNAHLMLEERKTIPDVIGPPTSVDFIQQHWTNEEEREVWANRIGNLALVSSAKPRSRKAKKSPDNLWENKCKGYKKESWLLTRKLSELENWDVGAVKDQQRELLSLMDLVWSLGQ